MGDYRDLRVWQKSRQLTRTIYEITDRFPGEEKFGLTSQLRRAAVSIGANVAEGIGRSSDLDCGRFVSYAIGSANEVEQHLTTAGDVGYLPRQQCGELIEMVRTIRGMLVGLRRTVIRRSQS